MDYQLQAFAATLATGTAFILGIEAFCRSWVRRFSLIVLVRRLDRRIDRRVSKLAIVSILIVGAYASGMLVENLAAKIVDRDAWPLKGVLLKTQSELRGSTLLKDAKGQRLCMELLDHGALDYVPKEYAESSKQILERAAADSDFRTSFVRTGRQATMRFAPHDERVLAETSKRLYYQAKNVVFREPNYFGELRLIEIRMGFARALAMIAASLVMVSLVFASIHAIRYGWRQVAEGKQSWTAGWWKDAKTKSNRRRLILMVGLLVLCCVSHFVDAEEEESYNFRVFGYFSTLLRTEAPCAGPHGAPNK